MTKEELYKHTIGESSFGFAYHRIVLDGSGHPVDYIFLETNETFALLTGLDASAIIGKRVTEVIPGIRDDDFDWIGRYGQTALSGKSIDFEAYTAVLDRWFRIHAFSPEPLHFGTTVLDISAEKRVEAAIREQTLALTERVKEMRLLVDFSALIQNDALSIAEILSKTVELIPRAFLHPERTQARIMFGAAEYRTPTFREVPVAIHQEIRVFGNLCGAIDVVLPYAIDSDPKLQFLPEEFRLMHTLAGFISRLAERVEMAETIKNSEAQLRLYIDSAPDAIFITDPEGRYIRVNDAARKLLGYPGDSLLDMSIPDVLMPESRDSGLAGFKLLSTNGHDSRELELRRSDGRAVWVAIDSTALPDGTLMAFCKDISDRKRAEERNALYARTIEALDQALIITDAKGAIVELNSAFENLYGYSRSEAIGRNPRILNPGIEAYKNLGYAEEDYRRIFDNLWKSLLDPENGTWEGTVLNRRKDGTIVWAQLHVNSIFDDRGRVTHFIGLPYDISESRRKEKRGKIELYSTIALSELRDNETGNHMRRVGILSKILAREAGMPEKYCEDIEVFAPMHDIGKVGISDSILLAPRPLTPEEWTEMKKHTILGYNIVRDKEELNMTAAITLSHHEKWDGTGYPEGKKGEDIPLSARIVAIVDVYDALRSERPYKRAWDHVQATAEIEALAGRHFDPYLVTLFSKLSSAFRSVHDELR